MPAPIQQISYEEAMRRFKHVYRMEKLPHLPVATAVWYGNDVSCGALVWVGNDRRTARIKGTVTVPEERGHGHGDALLRHLIQEAEAGGAKTIEVYAKDPAWYLRNGFTTTRVTSWNTTVLRRVLD